MSESVSKQLYEQKVRVRICGILQEGDAILLLKHEGIGSAGYIWSPPGGGLEFDENAQETLVREFQEETGLIIRVKEMLFVNEFKTDTHHAIELFFRVEQVSGELKLGEDPEVPKDEQILSELKWLSFEALQHIPNQHLHNIFHELEHPSMILESSGFYKFEGISKK
ncbi:NUDIX domain-containing protein [Marinoscillum sp.]|uniref:NUDIX domain-containing protein n=1 Tax=Marinoscillum sp. TaxID=2024838 RepID=UPI003BA93265